MATLHLSCENVLSQKIRITTETKTENQYGITYWNVMLF